MTARNRAVVELGVAVVAAIGTVVCWLAAGTAVATTPVLATEPSKIIDGLFAFDDRARVHPGDASRASWRSSASRGCGGNSSSR